ncbi:MAG TPA: phosphoribosylanthranilate isomerase [Vicinamibacterales bacterium]|nr:phosphoribosylanthranilate isomerase [Vicinamibacterales bacterium]
MSAPRVKVCGICRAEDAQLAVTLGASAIGFIFWPSSPRYCDPARAQEIAAELPPLITTVGVFVDQSVNHVIEIADRVVLGAVQLHGGEAIEDFNRVRQPLIKAVAVTSTFVPDEVDRLPEGVTVLLDAHDPVRRGGTGRTIDWTTAAQVAARRRTILSGGLHAANVRDAIACVHPHMVDVSSGVESAPGVKDAEKLQAFFAAVAAA